MRGRTRRRTPITPSIDLRNRVLARGYPVNMRWPRRGRRPSRTWVDVALALATAAWVWASTEVAIGADPSHPEWAGLVLGLLLGALQLLRRRSPSLVLLGSAALVIAYHALDFPPIGLTWPLVVPLFTAAATGAVRAAVATAGALGVVSVAWRWLAEGEAPLTVLVDESRALLPAALAIALGFLAARVTPAAARPEPDPQEPDAPGARDDPIPMLTPRESEVATLIAEGYSNAEIAERLYLSVWTVKSHVSSALRKVGLRDRTQLAAWVARRERER